MVFLMDKFIYFVLLFLIISSCFAFDTAILEKIINLEDETDATTILDTLFLDATQINQWQRQYFSSSFNCTLTVFNEDVDFFFTDLSSTLLEEGLKRTKYSINAIEIHDLEDDSRKVSLYKANTFVIYSDCKKPDYVESSLLVDVVSEKKDICGDLICSFDESCDICPEDCECKPQLVTPEPVSVTPEIRITCTLESSIKECQDYYNGHSDDETVLKKVIETFRSKKEWKLIITYLEPYSAKTNPDPFFLALLSDAYLQNNQYVLAKNMAQNTLSIDTNNIMAKTVVEEVRKKYCGNGKCDIEEDCEICVEDCFCAKNKECIDKQCVVKKGQVPKEVLAIFVILIVLVLWKSKSKTNSPIVIEKKAEKPKKPAKAKKKSAKARKKKKDKEKNS